MIGNFTASCSQIAELIEGRLLCGDGNLAITSVTTDSRELGDASLFIPLKGENFDGHDFMEELILSRKVAASLTMKSMPALTENSSTPLILCDDTLATLGKLGAHCRDQFRGRVYGVTGTNGKTTTKEIISRVLSVKYGVHKTEKNYNNEIGLPFALMGLNESHGVGVFEMGMNHSGEIARLTTMARPNVAIITNVGAGHLEYLGTVKNVAMAKSEILGSMGKGDVLMVNRDIEYYDIIEDAAKSRGVEIITVGMDENSQVFPQSWEAGKDYVSLRYGGHDLRVPLYGIHNVYNILFAIAIAEYEEIPLPEVSDAMANFQAVSGRGIVLERDFSIVDDTYNSNPLSSEMALRSVAEVFKGRRKFAVLADMKELGQRTECYHFEIGRISGELGFDFLCVHGEMASAYRLGAINGGVSEDNIMVFEEKSEIGDFLLKNLEKDDVVLVKGSRSMKMEEVVEIILRGRS